MHAAVAEKQESLAALCRRFGVARLEVFGSAARGVDFDVSESDVDFLVEFRPQADDLARSSTSKKRWNRCSGVASISSIVKRSRRAGTISASAIS
jgi:predicted nucleotidyltransferase